MASLHDVPTRAEPSEEALEREQLRGNLERLLGQLPDKQRLPIALHFFHGLSQREPGHDSVVWFDDSMGVKSSLPLESIERDWISPALECLRKGRLHSVRFVDTGNKMLTLTRRMLRRFWRRPKPFNGQKG